MGRMLFFVTITCFSLACNASLPYDYKLQFDAASKQANLISADGTKLSYYDVLQRSNLENCKDIPANYLECEAYFKKYLNSNPDTLDYCSDFWTPVVKTGYEVLFCCLDDSMLHSFWIKQKPFWEFINSSDDLFFKIDVVSKYFTKWKEIVGSLEKVADSQCSQVLNTTNVKTTINCLLDIVDKDRVIIRGGI